MPGWALGSFLRGDRRLPGNADTGFNARMGAGFFSTKEVETMNHTVKHCFNARMGAGFFSTGNKVNSVQTETVNSFNARMGAGFFSTSTYLPIFGPAHEIVSMPGWALGSFLRQCNTREQAKRRAVFQCPDGRWVLFYQVRWRLR